MKKVYPKFSVIIPTFNRKEYLEENIENMLQQNYENMEIIVADNASTDGTDKMMKKYKNNEKIIYFRNNDNIGLAKNWDKALKEYTNGEYVILLSDDDKITYKNLFLDALKIFEKDELINIVFAGYQEIDLKSGKKLRSINPNFNQILDGKYFFINYFKPKEKIMGVGLPLLTSIYKRKIGLHVGGYNKNIHTVDTLLFLKILPYSKVGYLNKIVAEYGIHDNNVSKEKELKIIYENLDYIREAYNYCKEKNLIDKNLLNSWKKRILVFKLTSMLKFVLKKCLKLSCKDFFLLMKMAKDKRELLYMLYSFLNILFKYNNKEEWENYEEYSKKNS